MKKVFCLLAALLVITGCSSDDLIVDQMLDADGDSSPESMYLSESEAVCAAREALSEFGAINMSRSTVRYADATVSLLSNASQSRSGKADSTFYVINFDGGGAVLLAADRRVVNKVYGLSLDSYFDSTPNPIQTEYMEWAYYDALSAANDSVRGFYGSRGNSTYAIHPDDRLPIIKVIDGIECYGYERTPEFSSGGKIGKAKWGQGYPYNYFCPPNCPTGCVAVALGQIMSHHQMPLSFNNKDYNWSTMLSSSKFFSINDDGAFMVARLLSEIGTQVQMNYSPSGSGASDYNVPGCLSAFGYNSSSVQPFFAEGCIYDLDKNHPIYVAGSSLGDRHGWIVESYSKKTITVDYYKRSDNTYYRSFASSTINLYMNWGWNGNSDGYFLAPGPYKAGGYEFNSGFVAVFNINLK